MKASRFTDSQIIVIVKQAEDGSPVPQLCREHSISNATLYKWRAKFDGTDTSLMARMTGLKDENRRLKKMHAEERLKGAASSLHRLFVVSSVCHIVPATFLAGTIADAKVAACDPDVSVSRPAQHHGFNTNMLFKWFRDLHAGLLTRPATDDARLLPVVLNPSAPSARPPSGASRASAIEIAIADATVHACAGTGTALLRLVLHSLRAGTRI